MPDSEIPGLALPSTITSTLVSENVWLLRSMGGGPHHSLQHGPVSPQGIKHYLAWALTSYFVTSPFFGTDPAEIPDQCQALLWAENSGGFAALVPILDGDYRSELKGSSDGFRLLSSCGQAGQTSEAVAIAVYARATDPYEAMQGAMAAAVQSMGRGKLRAEKESPCWMEHLGWCTWDAFYTEVDEAKILSGLRAFQAKDFMPGFLVIDEGWQDFDAKNFLLGFGTKKGAFTGDRLKEIVRAAKEDFGVKEVGCWRTLFGELRGVSADSEALSDYRRQWVLEPGTENDLFGVVEPADVARFQDAYSERMAADGVDFVKVDFQSALHLMTYEQAGRAEAARIWQSALQAAVAKHFEGEMLNCMAMGSGEYFHSDIGNVLRASDDFFPTKDDSHPKHIRQNLYNALWLSHLQWPDWDMFHSQHPWAQYHAVGRAISGGPIYVSDKPGENDCDLLRRFLASDGRVLRCPQPALPTRARLFEDPVADGKMIEAFNSCGQIALLAVFHPGTVGTLEQEVRLSELNGSASYAVFSVREGFRGVIKGTASLRVKLDPREADLLVLSPVEGGFAAIGLIDKWTPPAAIQQIERSGGGIQIQSRCGGRFGFFSDAVVSQVLLDGFKVLHETSEGLTSFVTPFQDTCEIQVYFVR